MAETIKIKIDMDSTPVKTLRQELKEATIEAQRLATAEVIDQEALTAAVRRTAELKDAMADVNEQVAVFASGSKYEQASNGLGQIGDAIRTLDFGKAQERAVAFANVAKTITFGDAIKSVQELGSTFMTIGRAILTNPLFLLAAVIAGIVVVVYKLLDALGVVKVVMDAMGEAIKFFTDGWFALTDAIGLTSKAAEDNLKVTVETNEKKAESLKEYYGEFERTLGNEIKLLKARDDGSEESADKIIAAERRLLAAKRQSAKEQLMLAVNTLTVMVSTGKATAEDLEKQRLLVLQLKGAFADAQTEAKVFDEKVKSDKKKADDKEKEDNEKKRKENETKRKSDNEKRVNEQKQFDADRLAAARHIEDQMLALQADGEDKEVAANRIKYQRLIADTQANEKLQSEEKKKLVDLYLNQELASKLAIQAKFLQQEKDAEAAASVDRQQAQKDSDEKVKALREEAFDKYKQQLKEIIEFEASQRTYLKDTVLGIAEETMALLQAVGGKSKGIALAALGLEKGVAIANVIINTMKEMSANAVTAAANPLNAATMGAAGAAQLVKLNAISKIRAGLRIATIAATGISGAKNISTGGGGGGGGGGGDDGGGGDNPAQTPSMGTNVQPTPVMNMNNGVDPNAGGTVNRQQVYVVDYTDIQNKGNELGMLQNRVTLG